MSLGDSPRRSAPRVPVCVGTLSWTLPTNRQPGRAFPHWGFLPQRSAGDYSISQGSDPLIVTGPVNDCALPCCGELVPMVHSP